ncbi:hypothetical protein TgHK011_001044 [Trichoderma gracile]|nr:hypothetical protein TgHK011_001044 [Trichoderma gracile]
MSVITTITTMSRRRDDVALCMPFCQEKDHQSGEREQNRPPERSCHMAKPRVPELFQKVKQWPEPSAGLSSAMAVLLAKGTLFRAKLTFNVTRSNMSGVRRWGLVE